MEKEEKIGIAVIVFLLSLIFWIILHSVCVSAIVFNNTFKTDYSCTKFFFIQDELNAINKKITQ